MTSSIRRTVLLTASLLATACSGGESKVPAAPRPSTDPQVATAPSPANLEGAALTATSPTAVPSVAHDTLAPKPTSTEAATSHSKDNTQVQPLPEQAAGRPLDPADVQVRRFVLATNVAAREPEDETDVFTTDAEKIFAFVELANDGGAPYTFKVHFEPADAAPSPYGIALEVATAPRFRTWAFTRKTHVPGRYRAVLRTPDGREIDRREFEIIATGAAGHAPEPGSTLADDAVLSD